MKTNVVLAGALLAASPTLAKADATIPDICKSAANYAAQAMNVRFSDGTRAGPYDPDTMTVQKDFAQFPVTSTDDLGNCDDPNRALKSEWCQVAGGSPEVYQVEVGQSYKNGHVIPLASVVVTYNRGGCWVDEVHRK